MLIKNDVDGEFVNSTGIFTYHLSVALFESIQSSPEHNVSHNHSDFFGSVPLSDELWRAEAISSTVCHLSSTYLQELWSSFHARFPTISLDVSRSLNDIPVLQLPARRAVLGLILLILIVILFPFLSFSFSFCHLSEETDQNYIWHQEEYVGYKKTSTITILTCSW